MVAVRLEPPGSRRRRHFYDPCRSGMAMRSFAETPVTWATAPGRLTLSLEQRGATRYGTRRRLPSVTLGTFPRWTAPSRTPCAQESVEIAQQVGERATGAWDTVPARLNLR